MANCSSLRWLDVLFLVSASRISFHRLPGLTLAFSEFGAILSQPILILSWYVLNSAWRREHLRKTKVQMHLFLTSVLNGNEFSTRNRAVICLRRGLLSPMDKKICVSEILPEGCGQKNQNNFLISGRPGSCLLTKMTEISHQLTITSAGNTASPRTDLQIKHSLISVLISDHSFI